MMHREWIEAQYQDSMREWRRLRRCNGWLCVVSFVVAPLALGVAVWYAWSGRPVLAFINFLLGFSDCNIGVRSVRRQKEITEDMATYSAKYEEYKAKLAALEEENRI